eukprot:5269953-Pleurochrysis_carterae.AAC.2
MVAMAAATSVVTTGAAAAAAVPAAVAMGTTRATGIGIPAAHLPLLCFCIARPRLLGAAEHLVGRYKLCWHPGPLKEPRRARVPRIRQVQTSVAVTLTSGSRALFWLRRSSSSVPCRSACAQMQVPPHDPYTGGYDEMRRAGERPSATSSQLQQSRG